jgi:hypothetical protein
MAAISNVPTEMMSARLPRKAGPGSKVSVSMKSTLYSSSNSSIMPLPFIHWIVGSGLYESRTSPRSPVGSLAPSVVVPSPAVVVVAALVSPSSSPQATATSAHTARTATPTRRLLRVILVPSPNRACARDHRF